MIEKLEMMRAWALGNGMYQFVEDYNDMIDKFIEQKRELEETKDKYERLLISIKK